MSAGRLAIRADADATIGAGHVMRCLALAQAWKRSAGEVTFLFAGEPPPISTRLRSEGMAVESLSCVRGGADDAFQTVARCRAIGPEWIVVDGYPFDAAYYEALKQSGLGLLAIDDYAHAGRYRVDFVLNQNVYATPSLYPARGEETELLLGARYLLLREEFLEWTNWQRNHPTVARRVLVTLGGGDTITTMLMVIDGLIEVGRQDLEVKLLCGHLNPNRASIAKAAEVAPFHLEVASATDDMPSLMAWADLGISAGGSTCWEMAFMGLPALALILADNQQPVVRELDRQGVVISLASPGESTRDDLARNARALLADPSRRAAMSRSGRALVDGQGASRVVNKLLVSNRHVA